MRNLANTWAGLEAILRNTLQVQLREGEILYLRESFFEIESAWRQRAGHEKPVSVLLLGEAPLFGREKRYIYMDHGKPASFLRPSAFPCVGVEPPKNSKNVLHTLLDDFRVTVVDVFPFALNKIDTPSIDYNKLRKSKFDPFFRETFAFHTGPRIQGILKHSPNCQILVRYKRLWDRVQNEAAQMGIQTGIGPGRIAGTWSGAMEIDRDTFRQACGAQRHLHLST